MEPATKKFKFSPGSIQRHEEMFMNLHNIAMGYVPRPVQQDDAKVDLAKLAMEAFPVPPAIHDSFQSWIRQNQLARFDCFLDPSTECECYKCKTVLAKLEADIDYFEARKDSIEKQTIENMDVVAPFAQQLLELPPIVMEETVPRVMNGTPLDVSVGNVAHFYVDIPETFAIAPSTPKLTTIQVDAIVSDHGKTEAQEKWVKLMQMTPTRLTF